MQFYETYAKVVDFLRNMVELLEGDEMPKHERKWFSYWLKRLPYYNELLQAGKNNVRKLQEQNERQMICHSFSGSFGKSEEYVLATAALRINGEKYWDIVGFDSARILEEFHKSGSCGDTTPLDRLTLFNVLYRYIYRWGCENLPKTSPEWKAYRALFLETAHVEVPEQFKATDNKWDVWEYRIKKRINECVRDIQRIHENTQYTVKSKLSKSFVIKNAEDILEIEVLHELLHPAGELGDALRAVIRSYPPLMVSENPVEYYKDLVRQLKDDLSDLKKIDESLSFRKYCRFDEFFEEDNILTYSALRIDGYKYRDKTNLDNYKIIKQFERTGCFGDVAPLDKLTCFFMLQRYLCKWGGERLEKTSPEWRAYRTLFLETAFVEVPERFLPAEELANRWEFVIKPRIDKIMKIVREIHENTMYEESKED